MTSPTPTTPEVLAANATARERHDARTPSYSQLATRAVDSIGRQWALKTNGAWAALGHDIVVDSVEELRSRFGVREWI